MPHLSQLSYKGMGLFRQLHPACIHGLAIVQLDSLNASAVSVTY